MKMTSTSVYLAGRRQGDSKISLPLPSAAILFVTKYCIKNIPDLHLVLVDEGVESSICVTLDQGNFNELHFAEEGYENCALPVIVEQGGRLIRSGLCSIIRQIVSIAHKNNPEEDFQFLLGFRGGSLKACAEISGWTKLCEVELPDTIALLIEKIRKALDSDGEIKADIELPENVMKLEWHFDKPPKLHNDDKQKRALLSQIRKKGEEINDTSKLSQFQFEWDDVYSHCVYRYRLIHSVSTCVENGNLLPSNESGNSDRNKGVNKVTDHSHKSKNGQHGNPSGCHNNMDVKFQTVEELSNFLKTLTIHNVEVVHQYSEGITITVADLILFPFIYHLLESLSFKNSTLMCHLPRIMTWMKHMITLPRIQEAALNCGYMMDIFDNTESEKSGNKYLQFFLPSSLEENCKEDELELSRRCRAKFRAIKPEVASALEKVKAAGITVEIGQHPCGDDVELSWKDFPEGVHPGTDLPKERLMRKCQQLENLVTAVKKVAKPGDTIVDFCSGGGHLGIVIAYLLPDCKIYLVENNESSLTRAKSRVDKANLTNVTLFQCNQDYFRGKFDVGTCLHACGSATDMVLHQCLLNNASFVICPCCYGGIQNTHLMSYPRSQLYQNANIPSKDFITLGHAADQTEFNLALEEQGKYCMNLVDTDRASLAKQKGYTVNLCSLKPLSCTPKNNILIGRPGNNLNGQ